MNPIVVVEPGTLVRSYLFLRRAIGLIGTALPFVLIIGNLLLEGYPEGLRNSVSGYYYSDLRDVYVGAMCAAGIFLLSYRGYDRNDATASVVGSISALGAALFPMTPPGGGDESDQIMGILHVVFAAAFFLTLAYYCLALFPRSGAGVRVTVRKVQRNRIYRITGLIILACLALIAISAWFLPDETAELRPALWLESIATLAFGIAWLTKGQAILGDLPPDPSEEPSERPADQQA